MSPVRHRIVVKRPPTRFMATGEDIFSCQTYNKGSLAEKKMVKRFRLKIPRNNIAVVRNKKIVQEESKEWSGVIESIC